MRREHADSTLVHTGPRRSTPAHTEGPRGTNPAGPFASGCSWPGVTRTSGAGLRASGRQRQLRFRPPLPRRPVAPSRPPAPAPAPAFCEPAPSATLCELLLLPAPTLAWLLLPACDDPWFEVQE